MADTQVNISYLDSFGFSGTDTSQFDYPTGICVLNSYLYVVDRGNNRVQKFNLTGGFIAEFTGFFGPEDITTDGTYLYITDSWNGNVVKIDETGAVIDTFTGFSYPKGIFYDNNVIYVANWQANRVDLISPLGAPINAITGLFFPESVAVYEEKIYVANTGLSNTLVYNFELDIVETLELRCNTLKIADNAVIAIEAQTNLITVIGLDFSYTESELLFPYACAFSGGQLFVTNGGNDKILRYSFSVETDIPVYIPVLRKLTRLLYPTGRAWAQKIGGVFNTLHHALAYSESRAARQILDIRNSILPDNDNFNATDAINWERALGLYQQPYLTLEERKVIIDRKMNYPGLIKPRQHWRYIQGQMQAVGFDVYIYENTGRIDPRTSTYGTAIYGNAIYGGSGVAGGFTTLANHVNPDLDKNYNIGPQSALWSTFFVGGPTFGSRAVVPKERFYEFRELLLKLKPAHMVGAFLLVDYIDDSATLEYESGGAVGYESEADSNILLETA